jgi:hypothetical protein
MEKRIEKFMEECGSKLDGLMDKLRIVSIAVVMGGQGILDLEQRDLRGAGNILVEVHKGIKAISTLLSDEVARKEYFEARERKLPTLPTRARGRRGET